MIALIIILAVLLVLAIILLINSESDLSDKYDECRNLHHELNHIKYHVSQAYNQLDCTKPNIGMEKIVNARMEIREGLNFKQNEHI